MILMKGVEIEMFVNWIEFLISNPEIKRLILQTNFYFV